MMGCWMYGVKKKHIVLKLIGTALVWNRSGRLRALSKHEKSHPSANTKQCSERERDFTKVTPLVCRKLNFLDLPRAFQPEIHVVLYCREQGKKEGHSLMRAGDKGPEKVALLNVLLGTRQGEKGRAEGSSLPRKLAVTGMRKMWLLDAGCTLSTWTKPVTCHRNILKSTPEAPLYKQYKGITEFWVGSLFLFNVSAKICPGKSLMYDFRLFQCISVLGETFLSLHLALF